MFQMFQNHLNWMCRVNQWARMTGWSEMTKKRELPKKCFFSQSNAGILTYALILNLGTDSGHIFEWFWIYLITVTNALTSKKVQQVSAWFILFASLTCCTFFTSQCIFNKMYLNIIEHMHHNLWIISNGFSHYWDDY